MGLLAKAEAYLEWEAQQRIAAEQKMAEEQMALAAAIKARPSKVEMVKNTATKLKHLATDFRAKAQTAIKQSYQPQFRRYAGAILALALSLQSAEPRVMNTNLSYQKFNNLHLQSQIEAAMQSALQIDQDLYKKVFTEEDIDNMTRAAYGEAGIDLMDNIEVVHCILNRLASPRFKEKKVIDVLTAENQFLGFDKGNPVLPEQRLIVKEVANDFVRRGCKEFPDCNHFYFKTGAQGLYNLHEKSPEGSHGAWVPYSKKVYSEPGEGCPMAEQEAAHIRQLIKQSQMQTQRVRLDYSARSL